MDALIALVEQMRARADEIEGFASDPDALPPSGRDTHTANLLRKAATELAMLALVRDGEEQGLYD